MSLLSLDSFWKCLCVLWVAVALLPWGELRPVSQASTQSMVGSEIVADETGFDLPLAVPPAEASRVVRSERSSDPMVLPESRWSRPRLRFEHSDGDAYAVVGRLLPVQAGGAARVGVVELRI